MNAVLRDVRYAARQLARNPGFTAAAVSILALGIGLNAAVFSVVNAALFRPLPVAAPEELVAVYGSTPHDFMATSALTAADYHDLAARSRSLTALLAYTYSPVAVEHAGESRLALGVRATPNFFTTLGLRPFVGRFFAPEETPGGLQEAVLGYSAWERRFGADPGVLGSTLLLDGRPATVIGVAPRGFFGVTRGVSPEVWTSLRLERAGDRGRSREGGWLWLMGRRASGVTLEQVRAELEILAAGLASEYPDTNADRTFAAFPANAVRILPQLDAKMGGASAVVLGVVGLVLLIACTNVANLLLARAVARRREIATRRALGASPAAVARQLLAESLLLALLGGALGLGLARASNAAISAVRLPIPIDIDLGLALDTRVVLYALAAATLTALAFGLAPALAAGRDDFGVLLREGGTASSRSQRRLGNLLVIAQVAVSLVLLVDTGLMVRSVRNAHRLDPGFDPRGVAVATFASGRQGLGHDESEAFRRRLAERVRALPGIESAAMASHLPLSIEITFERIAAAGTAEPPERWPNVDSALVGPGYFETLRIPVLRGRAFTDDDRADSPLSAVVNQSFAGRFWPGEEAVGRRLRIGDGRLEYEVVGIVRNGKYRTLGEAPRPFLYRAMAQRHGPRGGHTGEITSGSMTLVARTRDGAPAALADLRRVIRELDPRAAIARLETLEDSRSLALFLPRSAAVLFAVFGLVGLALAALGLYSLLVYTVGQRHREIGIRLALGATPGDIVSLVVRRGLGLALAGIVAGLAAAGVTTRPLGALLYGVNPTDASTFLAVAACLTLVALAASWLPARRAAAVDVSTTLRHE